MASKSKNQDIVELIIKGEDEYSDVSEEVRQELEELATQVSETREEFNRLERSLELADAYREQEAEVERLARAQAEARVEVERLTKANREAKGENVEIAEALAKARAELTSYRTATNRAQKALDKTKDSMRQYGVSLEEVESNQKEMQASSERLSAELSEMQKKQKELVATAKDEVQASHDRAKAQEEYNAALKRQGDAMAEQFRAYTKQQAEQRKVKEETERLTQELTDLAAQLEKGDISWEDFRRRATDAGRAADLTQKQVAGVRRNLEGLVTASRNANQALKDQERETARVEQATEDYRRELDKLLTKYQQGKISIDGFEKAEAQLRRKMRLTETQVESVRREMGAYSDKLKTMPVAQNAAAKSTDKLTQVTRRLAQAYTVIIAAQKALDLAMSSNRAYTESEDAMLGLQKTTELTAAEINGLVEEMSRLSGNVTRDAKAELLSIAEAAGRMGIQGAENISAFTKSVMALTSATDMASDETAQAIAQILNVTGEAQSNVVGVAATIAELGNTTATTEEQIVHFAKRLATDTKTAKLTSAEVLGIASSMAEMGLQAEGASTVIGRTFRFIEDAVKGGGKAMEDLQRITGKTETEIQQAFGNDKVGLFNAFVAGIARVQDGGQTLNSILSDMGIKSDENARILGLLSQTYGSLASNVDVANKAFEAGTAHFDEMAKKEAALSGSIQRLQNRVNSLKTIIGEAFSDDLHRGLDAMGHSSDELTESLAELGEGAADVVELFADFTNAVMSVLDPFDLVTGEVSVFNSLIAYMGMHMSAASATINMMTAGIAQLGIAWNKFFGDSEDVEAWTKIQEDAFARVDKSVQRTKDNINLLRGDTSRAFNDLRDAYNENREALAGMDEEQRKAVETIINSTGYLEGNDKAYRELTAAIRRAAEEQKIKQGLTAEENAQLESHIRLLKAQGISEEEATRIATEAAEKRKQATADAGEAQKKAAGEVTTALDEQSEAQGRAAEAAKDAAEALKAAWETLGLDADEVTGKLTEAGAHAASAFETIASSGTASAEQIMLAFAAALEQAKTEEDVKALEEALKRVGNSGKLMGMYVAEGLHLANERAEQLSNTVQTALDRSLKALGVDITRIKTGFTEMGREALDQLDFIMKEMDATGVKGKEAAEITSAAFEKALGKISTTKGLDELKAKLKQAANEGKISWTEYQERLEEIEAKYADLAGAAESSIDGQRKALAGLEDQAKKTAQAISGASASTSAATKVNAANAASSEKQAEGVKKYTHALFMAGKTQQEFAAMGSQMAAEYERIWEQISSAYAGKEITSTMQYMREMKRAEDQMNKMAKEAISRWERQETKIRQVEQALAAGKRMTEEVLDGLDLIDQQRLEGVRSAIQSMNAEAQSLTLSLQDTVTSLQQQLASLRGDTERSEQIRHEQKMLELRQQYEEAKAIGEADAISAAREAMRLQEQIHQETMRQIKEQKKAQSESQTTAGAGSTASTPAPAVSNQAPATAQPDTRGAGAAPAERVIRLQISSPTGETAEGRFSEQDADLFLKTLSATGAVVK